MNGDSANRYEVTVEPRGAVVMRGPNGEVPGTHVPFGKTWAVRLAHDLERDGFRIRDDRIVLESKDAAIVSDARSRLKRFWTESTQVMWPNPAPVAPVVAAGLVGSASLVPEGGDGKGLAAAVDRYLAARASRSAEFGVPAVTDRILRLVATLDVPSTMRAILTLDTPDRWTVDIIETGALEALRERIESASLGDPLKEFRLEVFHGGGNLRPSEVFSIARAVQVAWLVAAGTAELPASLGINVRHPGLGATQLSLHLRPEDWGRGLLQLARAVERDLARTESLPSFHELNQGGPQVRLLPAESVPGPGRVLAAPRPMAWQAEAGSDLPRWTYAGQSGLGDPAVATLPFAVAPSASGLATALSGKEGCPRLAAEDHAAYLDWLAGPRGPDGLLPRFGRLYLAGIEYRLLAGGAPQAEAQLLAAEIARIGGLFAPDDPLASASASLVDWLGATGRRALGPPEDEGPLSRLALFGRRVLEGGVLSASDLAALETVLFADPSADGAFRARCESVCPDGLVLRPIRIGLKAPYRSISGLCDVRFFVFRHANQVIPDLRHSVFLRAALDAIRAESTTGAEP